MADVKIKFYLSNLLIGNGSPRNLLLRILTDFSYILLAMGSSFKKGVNLFFFFFFLSVGTKLKLFFQKFKPFCLDVLYFSAKLYHRCYFFNLTLFSIIIPSFKKRTKAFHPCSDLRPADMTTFQLSWESSLRWQAWRTAVTFSIKNEMKIQQHDTKKQVWEGDYFCAVTHRISSSVNLGYMGLLTKNSVSENNVHAYCLSRRVHKLWWWFCCFLV